MSTASFRRNPLIITGNNLSSGERSTTFAADRPDSLLRSYLIFVRDLRGQRREPSIELRTEDVHVIAAHLGVSDQLVLGGLLDLMGATRAQRNAMVALLAAGALTLVLTGSFVTDLSTDGVSVEMGRLADAVQTAVQSDQGGSHPAASAVAATEAAPVTGAAPDGATADRETVSSTPTSDVLQSAGASTRAPTESPATAAPAATSAAAPVNAVPEVDAAPDSALAHVAGEPVSIAVAPDGSLVASVAPPIPTATPGEEPGEEPVATTALPDGTTVGVAAPPVPPPPAPTSGEEPVATTELPDGTTVGVAAPPVPPPAEG